MDARAIVIDSYRLTGLISDYDLPDGNQTQIGLETLNQQLGQLNMEGFFAFTQDTLSFPSFGKQYVSIGEGVGADVTNVRPTAITSAYFQAGYQAAPYKLDAVAYDDIMTYRGSPQTQGSPSMYAYKSDWPNSQIHFNLIPFDNGVVTINYFKPFAQMVITDIVPVPPEYESAIRYAVATQLAKRYGSESMPILKDARDEEVNRIKRNTQVKTPFVTSMLQNRNTAIVRNNIVVGGGW
jgi:hypothetical protein